MADFVSDPGLTGVAPGAPAEPSALPDASVPSGKVGYMLDPAGRTVQLPAEQMQAARQQGYADATPGQIADALSAQEFHRQYGGLNGEITAAGLALARGATLGLSDAVGSAIDPEWADRVKAYQTENPDASMAGTAASLVASGPLLKLGGIVSKAVSGSEALSGLTGTVGQIVKKAVSEAAGSAVLGAAYGAGNVVSEAALGDPAMTGQSAFANGAKEVGLSAIFAGALGGGASAAWNIGKALVPEGLTAKISNWLEQSEGMNTVKSTGAPRAQLKKILAIRGDNEVAVLGREAEDLGIATGISSASTIEKNAAAKMDEFRDKLTAAYRDVGSVLSADEQPNAQSIIMKLRARVAGPILDDPAAKMSGAAEKLNGLLDDYAKKYQDGMTLNDLWSMRKGIDSIVHWGKANLQGVPTFNSTLIEARGELQDEIYNVIKNGAKVPASSVATIKQLSRGFEVSAFMHDLASGGSASQTAAPIMSFGSKVVAGAGGLEGAVHGAATGHSPLGTGTLVGAALGVANEAATTYGPSILAAGSRAARRAMESGVAGAVPEGAGAIMRAAMGKTSAGEAEAYLKDAGRDGALGNLIDETGNRMASERRVSSLDPTMNEPVGDGATPMLSNPEKVAFLAHLERTQQDMRNAIDTAAKSAVRDSPKNETTSRNEVAPGVDRSFASTPDAQLKKFTERVSSLNRLMQDPDTLVDVLTSQTDHWHDHAPSVAAEINASTVRALNFLASKLPHQDAPGALMGQVQPARGQVAAFNRYWEAVEHPVRIFKQMGAGNVTDEAIETGDNVYPALMQEFRQAAIQAVTDRGAGAHIPYQRRLALGKLLKEDVDGTANGLSISSRQSVYARQPAQPQGQGASTSQPAKSPLSGIARRSRTTTQRSDKEQES